MAIKLFGDLRWWAPTHNVTWHFKHVVTLARVTNYHYEIPPVIWFFSHVVLPSFNLRFPKTYEHEIRKGGELPWETSKAHRLKPHDLKLFTWQNNKSISSISQDLWRLNLAGVLTLGRKFRTQIFFLFYFIFLFLPPVRFFYGWAAKDSCDQYRTNLIG